MALLARIWRTRVAHSRDAGGASETDGIYRRGLVADSLGNQRLELEAITRVVMGKQEACKAR